MTDVTDTGQQDCATILMADSCHVTDAGQRGDNVNSLTDSRNTCHFCQALIPRDVPLWRVYVRTGERTWTADGRHYPVSATVSACRACAIREVPHVAQWADRPMAPYKAEPTPYDIDHWEHLFSCGWYDFAPGE